MKYEPLLVNATSNNGLCSECQLQNKVTVGHSQWDNGAQCDCCFITSYGFVHLLLTHYETVLASTSFKIGKMSKKNKKIWLCVKNHKTHLQIYNFHQCTKSVWRWRPFEEIKLPLTCAYFNMLKVFLIIKSSVIL